MAEDVAAPTTMDEAPPLPSDTGEPLAELSTSQPPDMEAEPQQQPEPEPEPGPPVYTSQVQELPRIASRGSRGSRQELQPEPFTNTQLAFKKYSQGGILPLDRVDMFLSELAILNTAAKGSALAQMSNVASGLSYEQALQLVGLLNTAPLADAPSTSSGASSSGLSRQPLKRALTSKSKTFLETGNLAFDDAVVTYMQKLDQHRQKCVGEGRYAEAKAAAKRLADLKTAQVERLRQELINNQQKELTELQAVYEDEAARFNVVWDSRVREYEANFGKAVEDLKAMHRQQLEAFMNDIQRRRPQKPKPSRDYLNQRRIETSLARTKQYTRAGAVKSAADQMYTSELEQAVAAYEAEARLRIAKFTSKQQQELEALLQRGMRGREELELKRISETERRNLRYRNIVAELENLHRLEVVQLENFLDAQVQAGKASKPIKDGFRRKREQLYSTTF